MLTIWSMVCHGCTGINASLGGRGAISGSRLVSSWFRIYELSGNGRTVVVSFRVGFSFFFASHY